MSEPTCKNCTHGISQHKAYVVHEGSSELMECARCVACYPVVTSEPTPQPRTWAYDVDILPGIIYWYVVFEEHRIRRDSEWLSMPIAAFMVESEALGYIDSFGIYCGRRPMYHLRMTSEAMLQRFAEWRIEEQRFTGSDTR